MADPRRNSSQFTPLIARAVQHSQNANCLFRKAVVNDVTANGETPHARSDFFP
jgi:hypothetical protein